MDCSMARIAWIHYSVLDGKLGRLFDSLSFAHCDRTHVWISRACGADRRIHLATAHADPANEMGAHPAFGRALARNDSDGGRFSMELSMAAALPSRPRTLRCGSAATASEITNGLCIRPGADPRHRSDADLWDRR